MFRAIWWMLIGAAILYVFQNPTAVENTVNYIKAI